MDQQQRSDPGRLRFSTSIAPTRCAGLVSVVVVVVVVVVVARVVVVRRAVVMCFQL